MDSEHPARNRPAADREYPARDREYPAVDPEHPRGSPETVDEEYEQGGDPVCWAHLVCPECGAISGEGHRPECELGRGTPLRVSDGVSDAAR